MAQPSPRRRALFLVITLLAPLLFIAAIKWGCHCCGLPVK